MSPLSDPAASPAIGLHHVTAIAGAAQEHVDFYAGVLGLRLVKRTVNFDDPGTYHLYYADGFTHPGSFLTFFPFADARAGTPGAGMAVATAYVVPEGAHAFWTERFAEQAVDFHAPTLRFGQPVLAFRDPHGLEVEFVEAPGVMSGWADGPIPLDAAAGHFHSVTLALADPEPTARLLEDVLGYADYNEEGGRLRMLNERADRAALVDLVPTTTRGRGGAGTVHHVAFRVPDDEAQLAVREALLAHGLQPTEPIDRQYFRSVYVREPGGVLFEIATDPPGFAVDEPADALGRGLMLPPQYESLRARIEAVLPPLRIPYEAAP